MTLVETIFCAIGMFVIAAVLAIIVSLAVVGFKAIRDGKV